MDGWLDELMILDAQSDREGAGGENGSEMHAK